TGMALAAFLLIVEPKWTFMPGMALSGLLAVGLASVQILPTMEWLRYIHHSLKDPWPAPPIRSVLGLVLRDIVRARNAVGLLIPEHAGYLAMMTFVAAPVALLRKASRRFAVFFGLWAIFAFSVAYAVGPAHWLIQHIPVLNMLKNAR